MDKAKKKRLKQALTWASLAALVALLTAMPLIARQEAEADGPVASLLSAQVVEKDLSTNIHGGGTLTALGAEDVEIPEGVKITEFLVRNGDQVTAGTPVAEVDKVSVLTAISEVADVLDFLQEEIQDGRDEKVSSSVTAAPGGRVKAIYAEKGDSVQEVMLEHGCLAILSIDSLMAVDLEVKSPVTTGETLEMTLSDGTVIDCRVERNLNGVVTLTVDDEGYAIGEAVSVEGLGEGTLYVHNAWKATAYAGTISQVHTEAEKTLYEGAQLFTLTDTDYLGQMQWRASQHREYEALMQKLLKMYESGYLEAPCDGIISGVDEDSVHLLSGQIGEYTLTLLTAVTEVPCTGEADCIAEKHNEDCLALCTTKVGCPATRHRPECITFCRTCDEGNVCPAKTHYSDCIEFCTNGTEKTPCTGTKYHYLTCISSCTVSDGKTDCPATKEHYAACIKMCSHAEKENVCQGSKNHYADCVELCTNAQSANETCTAVSHKSGCYYLGVTYTATAAKVFAAGNSELVVFVESVPTAFPVKPSASGWKITEGKLETSVLVNQTVISAPNASSFQKDDIILLVTGQKGEEVLPTQIVKYQSASTGSGATIPGFNMSGMDISAMMGSMMSGMSGLSGYSGYTVPQESESLYPLEGEILLTVTPGEKMELEVLVDEQDIHLMEVGITGTVKIQAIRDKTFHGTVTKVGLSGANSGGSSKFTVTLEVDPAGEEILEGMSATVTLYQPIAQRTRSIPLAALTEEGGKTIVYTAVDEKTGEPSSPKEVITGVSDGENVQILSGLEFGDTVYYWYYDTLELNTSAEAQKFSLG